MAVYQVRLLHNGRGVATGTVLCDGQEIASLPEADREGTLAMAAQIAREHREGWITTETVTLDEPA